MKFPWANSLLLLILVVLAVTGYLGLTEGAANGAWRLWLHGIAAYGLIFLFIWKSSIILDAFRRKKTWTRQRLLFAVLLFLLLLTVGLGLLWTLNGPLYVGGFSLVSLHIYLAVPVMLLVLWHVWRMRFIFRVQGALDRRLFLRLGTLALGGLFLERAAAQAKMLLGLEGVGRRFTGSYEAGSYTGQFPIVSWLADRPAPVDIDAWRLRLDGAVAVPLLWRYTELLALPQELREATLDCTGGWYTVQFWEGVSLAQLFAQAGLTEGAQSITVRAVSGYKRRFTLPEANDMLLALNVAGQPLAHGHGGPLRLVVPGRRGYDWVKWVSHIRVNETSAYWQSPLPLQ